MARSDVDAIVRRADDLVDEINEFVPCIPATTGFRADLAGLLVVSIAASYEAVVKETLNSYAARHHGRFEYFTQKHFERLNSRVMLADLYKLARTFDDNIHTKFGQLIKTRCVALSNRTGKDPRQAYEQILKWRHSFAHARARLTTVEEASETHRTAKRILYLFDEAFSV